jgi:aryl-alcohol dehydrogenase-like predicted oxidoreductase
VGLLRSFRVTRELTEKRDIRDQLVIATKVCAGSVAAPIVANLHGYLKMIYEREQKLHWQPRKVVARLYPRFSRKTTQVCTSTSSTCIIWEYSTSAEEVMDALHILVVQGQGPQLGACRISLH